MEPILTITSANLILDRDNQYGNTSFGTLSYEQEAILKVEALLKGDPDVIQKFSEFFKPGAKLSPGEASIDPHFLNMMNDLAYVIESYKKVVLGKIENPSESVQGIYLNLWRLDEHTKKLLLGIVKSLDDIKDTLSNQNNK